MTENNLRILTGNKFQIFGAEIRNAREPNSRLSRELDVCIPATLQDFRPEKDLSLLGVPNRMATDFVGLRAMPFSNPLYKSVIRSTG